jgi:GNAT superfamily N-acetyltransferase
VRIRALTAADAEPAARLSTQLGYPTTPAAIRARIDFLSGLPDHALFAAEAGDGAVLGWLHVFGEHLLEEPVSYAEIGGLVVDESARRQGVGRALLRAAEEWAARHGYPELRLRTSSRREDAHAFYRRSGYVLEKTQLRFRKPLR